MKPTIALVLPALLCASVVALAQEPQATSPTSTPAAAQPAQAKPPASLEGVFKNAFILRTPDGKSELRVGTQVERELAAMLRFTFRI